MNIIGNHSVFLINPKRYTLVKKTYIHFDLSVRVASVVLEALESVMKSHLSETLTYILRGDKVVRRVIGPTQCDHPKFNWLKHR